MRQTYVGQRLPLLDQRAHEPIQCVHLCSAQMRFASGIRITPPRHSIGLLGNVVCTIQLTFPSEIAGIADIWRTFQIDARRIVVCSTNCPTVYRLAGNTSLLAESVTAQLHPLAFCSVPAIFPMWTDTLNLCAVSFLFFGYIARTLLNLLCDLPRAQFRIQTCFDRYSVG